MILIFLIQVSISIMSIDITSQDQIWKSIDIDISAFPGEIYVNDIRLKELTSGVEDLSQLDKFGSSLERVERNTPISSHLDYFFEGMEVELANYTGSYELTDLVISDTNWSLKLDGLKSQTKHNWEIFKIELGEFSSRKKILPEQGTLSEKDKRIVGENQSIIRILVDEETGLIHQVLFLSSPI